uniref:Uncharacterized protein n=1 Tax=Chrysotila carterae TaxID=13221 RepID=A0A7S4EVT0_CHRCT
MSLLEALNLLASVYGTYHNHATHKQTLSHDQELHVRALAASTEQHYQQLIAELLAAAKEADRDVWEQVRARARPPTTDHNKTSDRANVKDWRQAQRPAPLPNPTRKLSLKTYLILS